MLAITKLLFLLFLLTFSTYASDRHTAQTQTIDYYKKSIASPGRVYLLPNAFKDTVFSVSETQLSETLIDAFSLSRFEFNPLPKQSLAAFSQAFRSHPNIHPSNISQLFHETFLQDILFLLNDPDIQEKRLSMIYDKNRRVTLAETKGKITDITSDELSKLMNSAYLYFPYIHSIRCTLIPGLKRSGLIVRIKGAVLWFQVHNDGLGTKHVSFLKQLNASGTGILGITHDSTSYLKKNKRRSDQSKRSHSNEKKNSSDLTIRLSDLDPIAFYTAFDRAFQSWSKKQSHKLKQLNDFQLSGRVLESKQHSYTLSIGKEDGVELDDVFFLMDYEEVGGQEVATKMGFLRITNTGNKGRSQASASQLLGQPQSAGGWVLESPRRGQTVSFSIGKESHILIHKEELTLTLPAVFPATKTVSIFQHNLDHATQLNIEGTQTMTPYLGISQFFLYLNAGLSWFDAKTTNNTSGTPLLFRVSAGLRKKFWFRNKNISLSSGISSNELQLEGSSHGYRYDYRLSSIALQSGLEFEMLLSPFWSSFIHISHLSQIGNTRVNYAVGSKKYLFSSEEIQHYYPNTSLSGTALRLGLRFHL